MSRPAEPATAPAPRTDPSSPAHRSGWFRAFWRWHFYASFLVIPVVLLLSTTGAIYLLRFQVEPALHSDLMTVTAPTSTTPAVGYATQQDAVATAMPGATVLSMTEPRERDRSTVFSVETEDGSLRDAFVDPWTGRFLGDLNPDTTLSGAAIRLHGDLMTGRIGDAVIELAACWGIVMAITGYVLHLRGRGARARRLAARARGAALRSRHATVGALSGGVLLFLLVSGLPWTGLWGEQAQRLATDRGTSFWGEDPGAASTPGSPLDESLPHSHTVPWGLGKTDVPRSGAPVGDAAQQPVPTVDTAVAVGAREGLHRPMTVAMPDGDEGVYSVIGFAFEDPVEERTVHVDRFGGQVVSTYGWDDYPLLAKTVSQGIALHEGRRFGTANLLVTLAMCVGLAFLCLSGPVMWWRRRPKSAGTFGAPRGRLPVRASPMLAAGLIVLALSLPLFGVSLLLVLLADQLLLRRIRAFRRWFSVT